MATTLASASEAQATTTMFSTTTTAPAILVRDYEKDRGACTEECNAKGFCCTTRFGGCQQPTCTEGCHFAWYASAKDECTSQCRKASGKCSYTHNGTTFNQCGHYWDCGCPKEGDGNAGHSSGVWGSGNDCG